MTDHARGREARDHGDRRDQRGGAGEAAAGGDLADGEERRERRPSGCGAARAPHRGARRRRRAARRPAPHRTGTSSAGSVAAAPRAERAHAARRPTTSTRDQHRRRDRAEHRPARRRCAAAARPPSPHRAAGGQRAGDRAAGDRDAGGGRHRPPQRPGSPPSSRPQVPGSSAAPGQRPDARPWRAASPSGTGEQRAAPPARRAPAAAGPARARPRSLASASSPLAGRGDHRDEHEQHEPADEDDLQAHEAARCASTSSRPGTVLSSVPHEPAPAPCTCAGASPRGTPRARRGRGAPGRRRRASRAPARSARSTRTVVPGTRSPPREVAGDEHGVEPGGQLLAAEDGGRRVLGDLAVEPEPARGVDRADAGRPRSPCRRRGTARSTRRAPARRRARAAAPGRPATTPTSAADRSDSSSSVAVCGQRPGHELDLLARTLAPHQRAERRERRPAAASSSGRSARRRRHRGQHLEPAGGDQRASVRLVEPLVEPGGQHGVGGAARPRPPTAPAAACRAVRRPAAGTLSYSSKPEGAHRCVLQRPLEQRVLGRPPPQRPGRRTGHGERAATAAAPRTSPGATRDRAGRSARPAGHRRSMVGADAAGQVPCRPPGRRPPF